MILPRPEDAIHKAWLYRVLTGFCDNPLISNSLYFKGGTCAGMRGLLDRFSIDLDFDYVAEDKKLPAVRKGMEEVFKYLGLEIKDKSQVVPQFFLKYNPRKENERNTIKIDVTMPPPESNIYEPVRLNDIDRILYCQTIETMFANKLVALIDRFEKTASIAGRDLYDIHYYFISGYRYSKEVILERRNIINIENFFVELSKFINDNISETIISQDLNMLLPYEQFKRVRKILKQETLMFLNDEIKRIDKI